MEGLDEWEVLSDGGFLDIHGDDCSYATLSDNLFKNYFRCPSPRAPSPPPPYKFKPAPVQLEDPPPTKYQYHEDAEVQEKNIITSRDLMIINPATEKFDGDGQDPNLELFISSPKKRVFFVKKETVTEFVDMKLDLESPKSNNNKLSRPSSPTQFMAQEGPDADISSPNKMVMGIKGVDTDDEAKKQSNWGEAEDQDQNKHRQGGGNMNNNILKWSLTGIGAICSFGVATVCIFVLGGLIKNSGNGTARTSSCKQYHHHHHHQDPRRHQKLQFHIYAEDKRLKTVGVEQQQQAATKLNEAISAVRDIPFSRAHITFGGFCDTR